MSDLPPRQERFAQAIAAGKNGPQASREAGYAANPHAARVNASRRLAKASVAARVAELQAEYAVKNAITIDGQLSKLEEVRLQAIEDRNQSAAVAAIVAESKLCGLIIDKAQVEAIVRRPSPAPGIETGVIMSEEDWQQRLLARPHANGQGRDPIRPDEAAVGFHHLPGRQYLFGGARGGAKTIGSLLDFWYHAIEHGPNALGLMVAGSAPTSRTPSWRR